MDNVNWWSYSSNREDIFKFLNYRQSSLLFWRFLGFFWFWLIGKVLVIFVELFILIIFSLVIIFFIVIEVILGLFFFRLVISLFIFSVDVFHVTETESKDNLTCQRQFCCNRGLRRRDFLRNLFRLICSGSSIWGRCQVGQLYSLRKWAGWGLRYLLKPQNGYYHRA